MRDEGRRTRRRVVCRHHITLQGTLTGLGFSVQGLRKGRQAARQAGGQAFKQGYLMHRLTD